MPAANLLTRVAIAYDAKKRPTLAPSRKCKHGRNAVAARLGVVPVAGDEISDKKAPYSQEKVESFRVCCYTSLIGDVSGFSLFLSESSPTRSRSPCKEVSWADMFVIRSTRRTDMKDTVTPKRQPAEEILKSTQDKSEFAADTIIDSMTLVNRSYVYEFASEAYCRAHGRSREEIIGNSVANIWGETDFKKFIKKHLDQCFVGNVVRYENWLEFPGEGHRCFRVSYSPYFNAEGEVTHAVVASLDITDLKKEEEALEKSEPGSGRF